MTPPGGNRPLQERAGSNIGLALIVPSASIANSVFKDLVVGDNELVLNDGESNARFIGIFFSASVLVNNNSGVAISGQLLWRDGRGNETVLDSFVGLANGTFIGLSPNTKLGAYATLAQGESLVLVLAPAVGYAGGAIVQAFYEDLYRAVNTRVDLDTELRVVAAPVSGRTLQPSNLLASPQILNLDTVPHTVDIYANDGVSDLLLYKNLAVASGVAANIAGVGPGNGQALKAKLNEPLSAPEKRVIFIPCYVQYDA